MAFDNEHIAKEVLAALEAGLADALDDVEDEWAGDDPLSIPEPETWHYGHKPTVIEMESTAFPFVAVIPTGRKTLRGRYGWGFQDQVPVVYVDWFVVAEDETTVDKLCSRYGQAILSVVQAQRAYYGYDLADYEPAIDLSEASRHPQTADADMFDPEQVDFIKLGRLTLEFGSG